MQEPNIGPFRRAVCGDLTSAFNFRRRRTARRCPRWPAAARAAAADALRAAQQALAVPVPSDINLPEQATGTRPSRALPYELHASARAHVNGQVEILFANSGTQAAVFHVYDRIDLNSIPRRYMVEAGKNLSDSWSTSAAAPASTTCGCSARTVSIAISRAIRPCWAARWACRRCAPASDIANGDVYVDLMNTGKAACTFRVAPLAYRTDGPWEATVAPGGTQTTALVAQGQRAVVRLRRDDPQRHRVLPPLCSAAWKPASTPSPTRRWARHKHDTHDTDDVSRMGHAGYVKAPKAP